MESTKPKRRKPRRTTTHPKADGPKNTGNRITPRTTEGGSSGTKEADRSFVKR